MTQATLDIRKNENNNCKFDSLRTDFGMNAFIVLHQEAKANGIHDMSLDEINEEIRKTRYEQTK